MAWLSLLHFCHLPQDEFAWIASSPRMRRRFERTGTQLAAWSHAYPVPAALESQRHLHAQKQEINAYCNALRLGLFVTWHFSSRHLTTIIAQR